MDAPNISLVILNMITVALGVDFLLRELTGYDRNAANDGEMLRNDGDTSKAVRDNNFIIFDLFNRTLLSGRFIPSPECKYCGFKSGE